MFKGKGKIVNAVKRAGLIATTLYYGGGQTLVAKAGEFDWEKAEEKCYVHS